MRQKNLDLRGKYRIEKNCPQYGMGISLFINFIFSCDNIKNTIEIIIIYLSIGVQKPGPSYSPAIYTIDIAYKIDIPL